ncbi:MAG: hypothetical protein ABEH77_00970 [Halobacteriaceae archaeon]
MFVRDAVQDDADDLAALADLPVAAATHLIVERTVRVACEEDAADGTAGDGDGGEDTTDGDGKRSDGRDPERDDGADGRGPATGETVGTPRGFVAFDAQPGVVHVTQLAGDPEAVGRLLEEPAGFADSEGMAVEAVVPDDDEDLRAAVESFGFDPAGEGPHFGEEPTRRYRLE